MNDEHPLQVKNRNTEFVPARDAGRIFGYTRDYVARLARQKKIKGRQIGCQWFVDPESLASMDIFIPHRTFL